MLGFPYFEKTTAPKDHPCLTCHAHGPYCADFCVLLDAWRTAQRKDKAEPPCEPTRAG